MVKGNRRESKYHTNYLKTLKIIELENKMSEEEKIR